MNLDVLKDYVPYLMEMNTEAIKTEQLPGESKLLNGIWFFLADDDAIEEVVQELFTGKPEVVETQEELNEINAVNN